MGVGRDAGPGCLDATPNAKAVQDAEQCGDREKPFLLKTVSLAAAMVLFRP